MYICFLTIFTDVQLRNIQTSYWVGQKHCGPPNQYCSAPPRHMLSK